MESVVKGVTPSMREILGSMSPATLWINLRQSRFARAVGVLSAGSVVAQGVSLATAPLLSRLYTPTDFGQLAVFMGCAVIAMTLVTLRYETAIVLPKSDAEASSLLALSLYLLGLLTVVGVLVALAVVLNVHGVRTGILSLSGWLPWAIVAGGASAIVTTATYWYNRQEQFGRTTAVRLAQGALSSVLPILLYFAHVPHGMIVGYLVAQLATGLLIAPSLLRARSAHKAPPLREVARLHRSAPKYLLPTNVLDTASNQLPVFLIAYWFSQAVAGQFSLAWRVLAVPMALVGTAIGQVFYTRAAALWPDRRATRSLLVKTWWLLAVLGAVPAGIMIGFGRPLFSLVFGPAWGDAGVMASILSLLVFANFIASPTSTIYLVVGLQRAMPWFSIAQVIYRPLAVWLGYELGDIHSALWFWFAAEVTITVAYHYLGWRVVSANTGETAAGMPQEAKA